MMTDYAICWLRRDLRLEDNAALYHALKSGKKVIPLFIFDTHILSKLNQTNDARVSFIYGQIQSLQKQLHQLGSGLMVYYGSPANVFTQLLQQYPVKAIYCNHDYEPDAIARDASIEALAGTHKVSFHSYKDQCIFEKEEVVKADGNPYTVFTPYSKVWKQKLKPFYLKAYPSLEYCHNLHRLSLPPMPTLQQMGFVPSDIPFPPASVRTELIEKYTLQRNFPALEGTSKLSVHLRFGTISIRALAREALKHNETFLNELIWRDFYMQILYHFPQVSTQAFKPLYNRILWRNNEEDFERWCQGKTGYPIVDAGMRQLKQTGFMHNRVRMITASFLCKHLLIDWRWGEAWFAEQLLDFDMSANNGGWQWAAGCGTDAAPYFRIFNPILQTEKFDKNLVYIKKYVPELNTAAYPKPMVDHAFARDRCLKAYGEVLRGTVKKLAEPDLFGK